MPQFLCYFTTRHYLGAFEARDAEEARAFADNYLVYASAQNDIIENGEIEVEEFT